MGIRPLVSTCFFYNYSLYLPNIIALAKHFILVIVIYLCDAYAASSAILSIIILMVMMISKMLRGTARPRGTEVRKVSNNEIDLQGQVIQGHWQWNHLIVYIRFPISLPLQLCLYLALLTRYYHLFPNI